MTNETDEQLVPCEGLGIALKTLYFREIFL